MEEKRSCIDHSASELSINRQCELIELNRSSYYYQAKDVVDDKDLPLMNLIDEIYTCHPFYGSRQMRNALRDRKLEYPHYSLNRINRKKVQRLMRKMGLVSVAPGPQTSKPGRGKHHKIYPYLLRGMTINKPGQVYCSDITYIRLATSFVYLTVVMDWHSRFVLSWEVSNSMDDSFCVSCLETALRKYDKPDIFNTDQGAQYTGKNFTGTLEEHGINISMDGKGRAMDNIMVERLWRSVKYEEIYLKEYRDLEELKQSLKIYFDFYNYERPHSTHGGRKPAEIFGIYREQPQQALKLAA